MRSSVHHIQYFVYMYKEQMQFSGKILSIWLPVTVGIWINDGIEGIKGRCLCFFCCRPFGSKSSISRAFVCSCPYRRRILSSFAYAYPKNITRHLIQNIRFIKSIKMYALHLYMLSILIWVMRTSTHISLLTYPQAQFPTLQKKYRYHWIFSMFLLSSTFSKASKIYGWDSWKKPHAHGPFFRVSSGLSPPSANTARMFNLSLCLFLFPVPQIKAFLMFLLAD